VWDDNEIHVREMFLRMWTSSGWEPAVWFYIGEDDVFVIIKTFLISWRTFWQLKKTLRWIVGYTLRRL
jgi:hypothetical protein